MSPTILVATDGTPAALGALRLARDLERERGYAVEVVGVVEPVPVFDAGFMVALPELELYESRQDALKYEIQGQIAGVTGSTSEWPVAVDAGPPGPRIVRRAEEVSARAIILGLGRHRPMDRVFGTETALQVIRVSHLPVLAVPEDQESIPTSAALGVDFSLFSEKAVEAAVFLMQEPWQAHLIHVMSGMEFLPNMSEDWRRGYEEELEERLKELGKGLEARGEGSVDAHVLEGEPAHELLEFVEGRGIDLIVAGSHGHSFVGRLLMGSVSTRLIRGSHVPVLVVPPAELWKEDSPPREQREEAEAWVAELKKFTRTHAGRRTTLELDDPEQGTRLCGKYFPLWGVDYDPRLDRIDIMLGRTGTVEGHLTHSIPHPLEITLESGSEGAVESLHIRLKEGRVVLRLHRS